MKALCWHGAKDVRIDDVPEPKILNPHDAIIAVKSTAICGSDLHLYHGNMPMMKPGDVLGHEFAGEVVEVGSAVTNLKVGDRVVIPFTISCGKCHFCKEGLWSACDNTNPNSALVSKLTGFPCAGLYGYTHLYGGYPGGQAEFVRVPFADVGALKIPDGVEYEKCLFISDIFPTGYMAAENCNIKQGDTIAVWGCGPVGLFAIKSAFLLGAGKVVAIDRWEERLAKAKLAGAEPINYMHTDVMEALNEMTGGLGPAACIDAVGQEAHGATLDAMYDEAMFKLHMETDKPHALREAILACRKGGTVSVPGVYAGIVDKFPIGIAFAKGLTFKMGQTHVQRYMQKLLDAVLEEKIDPTFVITHRTSLIDAPHNYEIFSKKEEECIKVVMTP